jgi:hypothetical protein
MKPEKKLEDVVRNDLDVRASEGTYDRMRDIVLSAHEPSGTTQSAATLTFERITIMRSPIVRLGIAAVILAVVGLGIVEFISTGGKSGVVWAEVVKNVEASRGVIFRARDTGSRDPNDDWPNGYRIFWRSAAVSRMDIYRGGQIHRTIYLDYSAKTTTGVLHDAKRYSKETMSDQMARADKGWNDPQGLLNLGLSLEHRTLGQKTIDGVLCEGIEATGPDGGTGRIWVGVETGYPVLVEIEAIKGGIRHTGTMDQFQWNVDLSAEGVEPEIPADYEPL